MGQACAKVENGPRCPLSHSPKQVSSLLCVEARQDNLFNLCPHEVALIRRSWESAKSTSIGLRIVVSILIKRPHFASYFGVSPGTAEELKAAPLIKSHAIRMTVFLDKVINAVNVLDEDSVKRLIQGIGMVHFHKGVNFVADNWLLFKRVLLEELCRQIGSPGLLQTSPKKQELEYAWGKLLRFVISEMKRGFLGEALKCGESDSSN